MEKKITKIMEVLERVGLKDELAKATKLDNATLTRMGQGKNTLYTNQVKVMRELKKKVLIPKDMTLLELFE